MVVKAGQALLTTLPQRTEEMKRWARSETMSGRKKGVWGDCSEHLGICIPCLTGWGGAGMRVRQVWEKEQRQGLGHGGDTTLRRPRAISLMGAQHESLNTGELRLSSLPKMSFCSLGRTKCVTYTPICLYFQD